MKNREIEFRGKTHGGAWVYGSLVKSSLGDYSIIQQTNFPPIHKTSINWSVDAPAYSVIPETVGQFTGRKGKSGTRIYEDDWVKVFGECGLVYYCNEGCMFMVRFATRSFSFDSIDEEMEAIGNIHENKEL